MIAYQIICLFWLRSLKAKQVELLLKTSEIFVPEVPVEVIGGQLIFIMNYESLTGINHSFDKTNISRFRGYKNKLVFGSDSIL